MDDMAKKELETKAEAMSMEEQKIMAHMFPMAVLFDELIKRNLALIEGTKEISRVSKNLEEFMK